MIFLYSEVRIVDKITDLPVNYSKYLTNRRPQTSQSRLPSASVYDQQQAPQPQFSQTEPAQQYRTTTYNYPGELFFLLYNIKRKFHIFLFSGAYTTTYRSSYTNQNPNRTGYGQSGGNNASQSAVYSKYV
jgi:hypothetical protein